MQVAHGLRIGRGLGRLFDRGGVRLQFFQFVGRSLPDDAFHRIGGIAAPVAVEVARHVADGGADGQHVHVPEQHAVGGAKVFVADIAAADDGGLVVGGERLVVHPAVQPVEVRQVTERLGPAQREGVVEPHLDVGMPVQRGQRPVQSRRAVVVQQEAHAHAAVGGLVQRLEQHDARHVVVPDVVLHV
jgi:hypothetical protein